MSRFRMDRRQHDISELARNLVVGECPSLIESDKVRELPHPGSRPIEMWLFWH